MTTTDTNAAVNLEAVAAAAEVRAQADQRLREAVVAAAAAGASHRAIAAAANVTHPTVARWLAENEASDG